MATMVVAMATMVGRARDWEVGFGSDAHFQSGWAVVSLQWV